ncbi:hypothetical protein Tco_0474913 [Tanacetum coccineum]
MHSNDMTCFKEPESYLRSLYQNSFVHVENPKQVEMTFLRFFLDAILVFTKSSGLESENNSSENALSKSVSETQMQMQEVKVDMDKELDAGLVYIRPVYDQVPFDDVQLTAQHNVFANEQQHFVQSEPIYDTHPLEKIDSNTTLDSTNMCHRGGEID